MSLTFLNWAEENVTGEGRGHIRKLFIKLLHTKTQIGSELTGNGPRMGQESS